MSDVREAPIFSVFSVSLAYGILAFIVVSLLLAIPARNWHNKWQFDRMEEKLQSWSIENITSHKGTPELYFLENAFMRRTNQNHTWLEFGGKTNVGQPNAGTFLFEMHVSLAPFPSLKGPEIWAVDLTADRRLTQAEMNEILHKELGVEPINF